MDEESESEAQANPDDHITQSKKPEVIEIAFDRLMGPDSWPVERRLIVDRPTLVAAIEERNKRHPGEAKPLSTGNAANFLKDFIRKPSCNPNWPSRLTDLRITARQVYGNRQIFEFVPFAPGDELPFPDRFDPTPDLPIIRFEALSIPLEARKLGRQDEPWLIQTAVSQRLIETHLAVRASECGLSVETLAHLQMSVKTQPEIDATFVASLLPLEDRRVRAYVTVEAKQIGERILEHQIREQIKVAFAFTAALTGTDSIDAIIPIILKVVRNPGTTDPLEARRQFIYVAQFHAIYRSDFDIQFRNALHDMPLSIQSAALYEPHPPIAGISAKPARPKNTAKPQKPRKILLE